MPTPPIANFHGRTAELAQLRRLFEECAARDPATGRFGGPRMAVVIAESGIGKSRLVQALYQQLTTDLLWDPPEVNYWPDAFMDAGVQLRVTPNMAGHIAQGPPRFAWLGARFHATDIRNLSERRSSLTELRHSIMTHAEILRAHGSAWADATGRIKHAIARDSVGETISQVADAAVPFGGLLAKLVAGGVKLVLDRTAERKSVEDASDEASKTLVDDVEESMRSLLDGKGGLPSILWLDDAQWIDAETQELLYRVWRIARERGWPLLVVITHWERPWRELRRQADGERGLVSFEGQPGVSIIELQDAEPDALRSYLMLQMPGLTPDQQSLMLEKSAGNFLTMVENVGQLLRVPANFVERRTSGALCPAGERVVREWQSERHKRVEQNFTELAPEVQDLLGWSSHLGMSFLHEVVEDFADQVAGHPRAAALLQECVDPLVILGRPNDLLREFRDRAFHDVAKHYFANYGQEHAAPLEAILRNHLAEWVNNGFNDDGQPINDGRERSAMTLPTGERRDFLGMAVSALRPSAADLWEEAQSIAWIRAMYLLVITDSEESLWNRVQQHGKELTNAQVNWDTVPQSGLFYIQRQWLADVLRTAGALECALALWKADHGRTMMTNLGVPERRSEVSLSLERIADIEGERGDLDGALDGYAECLEIRRALMAELGTRQSRSAVSLSLERIASIEMTRGDLDSARARYEECLEIDRALLAERETPQSRRAMSLSLANVANIEQTRGDIDSALARYEECLEIRRALMAQLETPQSRRDVSLSLARIADIERERGDLDSALARYKEGLDIARALMAELGTPQSRRDVSASLNQVASIEQERGELDSALARYKEGLDIAGALMAELGTPESRRRAHVLLTQIASIETERGDLDSALTRYEEGLEMFRALCAELGTPQSRRDVGLSLIRIASVEQERDDLDRALAHYEEGLAIFRALSTELGTPEIHHDVSFSLNRIASIEKKRGDLDGALARYEEGLQIDRALQAKLGTPGIRRDVSLSLNQIASIEHKRGDLDGALARYEEGLEIRRALMTELGTPESRRDVSFSLERVAGIEQARGYPDTAFTYYAECLEIRRALMAELETPSAARDLDIALYSIAQLEQARGFLTRARLYYGEIEDIRMYTGSIDSHEQPLEGALRTWLDSLSDREREVMKLYTGIGDGYRYSIDEISRIFKSNERYINELVTRGTNALRSILQSDGPT